MPPVKKRNCWIKMTRMPFSPARKKDLTKGKKRGFCRVGIGIVCVAEAPASGVPLRQTNKKAAIAWFQKGVVCWLSFFFILLPCPRQAPRPLWVISSFFFSKKTAPTGSLVGRLRFPRICRNTQKKRSEIFSVEIFVFYCASASQGRATRDPRKDCCRKKKASRQTTRRDKSLSDGFTRRVGLRPCRRVHRH